MSASAREVLASIDVEFSHNGEVYAFDLGSDNATVALAALSGAGFAVVPREPTEEMIKAYYHAMDGTHPTAKMNPRKALVDHHIKAQKRYRAMLSAAEGKQ